MSELKQILDMLERLDARQDKLQQQVEALAAARQYPTLATYKPSSPSTPSSPVIPGVEHVPCGPAGGAAPTSPTSPTSPIAPTSPTSPGSPRAAGSIAGGGVSALKQARGSFSASSTALQALSNALSLGGTSSGGGGGGGGGETPRANGDGTATPYGNLSLAAAAVGAGGPGAMTPPSVKDGREKDDVKKGALYPARVVLTTYPGQAGIHPMPISWGAGPTARERGAVVCSRIKSNLPIRNSIGAHAGSYSVYRALSIAMGQLRPDWRPDLTNTHPPFVLPPRPGWFGDGTGRGDAGNQKDWKIVSFDPWGAMSQEVWGKEYADGLDVRPTISQTKAHIKIEELDALARKGEFPVDGEIVIRSPELPAFPGVDQGVEVNTYKAAIDPVWYLPGIAARLGIDESTLRRALFEDTGGMYPELLTRPDIKVFLPPIGGMTVYIMGDPAKLADPATEVTCRPHDSCSGSDVFGSDICTCRPYLIFGISEAIKCAQRGGVGVVVYFQKEGRALGEVVKYMVYNRRKRGGDSAAEYFNNTAVVAGVKDARHQALMPDVLHWLGINHITNLISMSNMKYDAIIGSGITVQNRYEIPDELIPADGRVEIDAKIQSGYFSKKEVTDELVQKTKGRNWEDIVH